MGHGKRAVTMPPLSRLSERPGAAPKGAFPGTTSSVRLSVSDRCLPPTFDTVLVVFTVSTAKLVGETLPDYEHFQHSHF